MKSFKKMQSPEQACSSHLQRNHTSTADSSTPSISFVICIGFPLKTALHSRSPPCATKHTGSNSYLHATFEPYVPRHGLRFAEIDLLTVSKSRTKIIPHNFSSMAPTIWNGFPQAIHNSGSIEIFKSHLKKYPS